MIASGIVGTAGKFISATHIGIRSTPSFVFAGHVIQSDANGSTAMESFPLRSKTVVKSYFIALLSFLYSASLGSFILKFLFFLLGVRNLLSIRDFLCIHVLLHKLDF